MSDLDTANDAAVNGPSQDDAGNGRSDRAVQILNRLFPSMTRGHCEMLAEVILGNPNKVVISLQAKNGAALSEEVLSASLIHDDGYPGIPVAEYGDSDESCEEAEPWEIAWRVFPILTRREAQVLAGFAEGKVNKEVAIDLGYPTDATVKVHAKSLLRKLKVKNRTQAALLAVSRGVPAFPATH